MISWIRYVRGEWHMPKFIYIHKCKCIKYYNALIDSQPSPVKMKRDYFLIVSFPIFVLALNSFVLSDVAYTFVCMLNVATVMPTQIIN